MYESPIQLMKKRISEEYDNTLETCTMRRIEELGIEINKDELMKALAYDRMQYEKGYIDGVKAKENRWVLVTNGMPEEHESSFAKLYGTPKWNNVMFRKISDNVLITVEYENGLRRVQESHTVDGKWSIADLFKPPKVIAWMPMPEPFKEG